MATEPSKLADVVNAYRLDPKLLLSALIAATYPKALTSSSIDDESDSVVRTVQMSDIPKTDKVTATIAINVRLKALAHMLTQRSVVIAWLACTGEALVFQSLIAKCTVSEPVIRRADDWLFDRSRFEQRLLRMVDPQGSA